MIEVTVCCDDCGAIGGGGKTRRKAREMAQDVGWVAGYGRGRDYCPEHARARGLPKKPSPRKGQGSAP